MRARYSLLPAILATFLLGSLAACSSESVESGITDEVIRYPFQTRPASELASLERREAILRSRIKEDPRGGMPLNALAGLFIERAKLTGDMAQFDEAEKLARRSLKLLPQGNQAAQVILAAVAEARHDFPTAIRISGEAFREKANAAAISSLITANIGYGKLDEARRYAEIYVRGTPRIGPFTLLALIHEAQGNEQEAYRNFERALRSEDIGESQDSAWTRAFVGRLHMRQGHEQLARDYFDEALRILPNCHLALALRAELRERQGDLSGAEAGYMEAFNAMGEPPYLLKHALLKMRQGLSVQAEKLRDQAERLIRHEMSSGPYGHHNELARLLLDRGRPDDLKEALSEARKDAEIRQTSEAHALLAEALYRSGFLLDARASIRKALASGIKNPEINRLAEVIEEALASTAN